QGQGIRAHRPAALRRGGRGGGTDQRRRALCAPRARGARARQAARGHSRLAAERDEADRQPGLREHGTGLDPAARTGAGRADAQHAGRQALHRAGRARGRGRGRCGARRGLPQARRLSQMNGQGGASERHGWHVIVAYSLVCAASQVLWLPYAPIATGSAHYYGVTVGAIGWLAEIFPLLYVALAIPAGILLDRWFRPSLAVSGALVAAGGLMRLGGQSFAWAMLGQGMVAIAQPVVLSAVTKLAGQYLPLHQRASGIAVGSAGGFVGMVLALL